MKFKASGLASLGTIAWASQSCDMWAALCSAFTLTIVAGATALPPFRLPDGSSLRALVHPGIITDAKDFGATVADSAPQKTGGTMAKDPVCAMEVDEKQPTATLLYRGQIYYFCSAHCKAQFQKEPEKYASR